MKRIFVLVILFITVSVLLFSVDSNVTKIGGWGTGNYNDVFTRGNYAYIAADYHGLDIIDISSPSKPTAVGNTPIDSRNSRAMAVYVNGNYAYLACSDGLHIVDVSIPTSPQTAGFYSLEQYYDTFHGIPASAVDIVTYENYSYLMVNYGFNDSLIIDILDVSNPAQPHSTGSPIYIGDGGASDLVFLRKKNKNYLFYNSDMDNTLEIYDVSNPLSPLHKNTINRADKYAVNGNYAYITYGNELKILNIADPTDPQQVGTCAINYYAKDIYAAGNHVYLAENINEYQWQIQIIDVSNPATPAASGTCTFSGAPSELTVTGGTALVTAKEHGLYTFDVSKPATPRLLKNYDFSWSPVDIFVTGNRAYVADSYGELKIFDITAPTAPIVLGTYISSNSSTSTNTISAVSVYENYAYLATSENGLEIIKVSDPTKPVKTDEFCLGCNIREVTIRGHYAYLSRYNDNIFYILDLAAPVSPTPMGHLQINPAAKIHIYGKYALLSGEYGVDVVDIEDPDLPVLFSDLYRGIYTHVGGVCVRDDYAYTANKSNSLRSLDIFDFSRPSAAVRTGRYIMKDDIYDLCVNGNYVYLAASSGLYVMDVSHPGSPAAAGYLDAAMLQGTVTHQGKYIYMVTGGGGRFEILEFKPGKIPPQLKVNRIYLRFYADHEKNLTAPQSFSIDTPGDNKLAWWLETFGWEGTSKIDWIQCSQTSGTGSAEISVAIDPGKVEEMLKNEQLVNDVGCIFISAPNALNSELKIRVSIQIDRTTVPDQPFGELSSPPGNTIVSGSVPVTGWALDNIGVAGVQIYREAGDRLVFVGDAVFVEGARPDVELRYPDYPNYFKAGWGYMLLTQGLPSGDGPVTLHAIATDMEGNRVTLGTTTVTVANANSGKPFGAIDTPGQGDTISGKGAINFGWALTPLPNAIPTDGSTIRVWIDGLTAGQPVYNQYRQDLAEQFPGLNNSGGAVGYFVLDTTKYSNGVHTIAWSVEDDAGNADGIGSRYFQVRNNTAVSASHLETADRRFKAPVDLENAQIDRQPVQFKTGFHPDQIPETASLSEDGVGTVTIHQLERVEVDLGISAGTPGGNISGYLLVGNTHRPLPIGSTLDAANGFFYWQPGPGFVGTYDFIFVKEDNNRVPVIKKLAVKIAIN